MESEEHRGRKEGFREGIRQGIGVLSALKEAVEDTINEARERGDLSADRAREIIRDTMERAQAAAEDARERLDFVAQRDFEALGTEVRELRRELDVLRTRVARLEGASGAGPSAGAAGPGEAPGSGL